MVSTLEEHSRVYGSLISERVAPESTSICVDLPSNDTETIYGVGFCLSLPCDVVCDYHPSLCSAQLCVLAFCLASSSVAVPSCGKLSHYVRVFAVAT